MAHFEWFNAVLILVLVEHALGVVMYGKIERYVS